MADHVYYVSAQDGPRYSLMLGPLATHEEALALVDQVSGLAHTLDPRAWFWAWGTCGMRWVGHQGTMNKYFPEAKLMEDDHGA